MNVLFCGGGTAGHITPSLAVAERLVKDYPGTNIAFVGREGGNENRLIENEGHKLYTVRIEGLSRRAIFENFRKIGHIFSSLREAKRIIADFSPDAIFATGGYVSWPILKAGVAENIPAFIHESNATPGLVTRLMAKKCRILLLGSPSCDKLSSLENARFVGNPVRGKFGEISKETARRALGISRDDIFILSVGGSLGADRLNRAIVTVMKDYCDTAKNVHHVHACGKRYYESLAAQEKALTKGTNGCKIIPYIDDMPTYLSAADIVISRAGAMTLAEIAKTEIPAIIIPSPNVTDDHQHKNALAYSELGAAIVVNEGELDDGILKEKLIALTQNKSELARMKAAYRKLPRGDAAKRITEVIMEAML